MPGPRNALSPLVQAADARITSAHYASSFVIPAKPLIQLAAAQSWTLTFVRVTNEGEVHLLSSFRRKPLIQLLCDHNVIAGLDPAIWRKRQMRGSSPRMTRSPIVIPANASSSSFRRKPLIQLAATQSWTLTFVRVTNKGVLSSAYSSSSFRRKPESSLRPPKAGPETFVRVTKKIKERKLSS